MPPPHEHQLLHVLGGAATYASWAAKHSLVVSDILTFNFAVGEQDLALVTKEDFDACNTADPLFVFQEPGDFIFQRDIPYTYLNEILGFSLPCACTWWTAMWLVEPYDFHLQFVRPVKNLEGQNIELIGPFEQVFMEIRCPDVEMVEGNVVSLQLMKKLIQSGCSVWLLVLHPGQIIIIAHEICMCQMAKQTMGFSLQALHSCADQKLYHLWV